MVKRKSWKLVSLLLIMVLLSIAFLARPTSAIISQNTASWYWNSDTNITSVAVGDVNGDNQNEIVVAGYFNNGVVWNAQIHVLNAVSLATENVGFWNWGSDTQISSVAIGDVNGDGKNEIVTGGQFFDGTRWTALVHVLSASTTSTALTVLNYGYWYWTGDTQISSVAIGDVNGDGKNEIVTGGAFNDGTRWNALLHVLNASTTSTAFTVLNYGNWYWTGDTQISSVAIGDVNGDGKNEIVTGGSYFDGTRNNALLHVLSASTTSTVFNVLNYGFWYWTGDTYINSVALGNITGAVGGLSIITGGSYFDGTRNNALLHVLSASTTSTALNVQNAAFWYWTGNTTINSVATGNFTGGSALDIVTAGSYNDGFHSNAQMLDLNGANMATISASHWFTTSDTSANSVTIGNTGFGNRIVVGGSYFDTLRSVAQLIIWT